MRNALVVLAFSFSTRMARGVGSISTSTLRRWLQFRTSKVCAPRAIEVYNQTSQWAFSFVCGIVPRSMTKVMVIGGTANPYGAEGEFLEVHLMSPFPSHPPFAHAR